MFYLIRHEETGREAQPQRRKLQRDLVEVLQARIPSARTFTDHGRVFLETAVEAADTLAELHGVASFSPCRPCHLGALEAAVLALSDEVLSGKQSFAVRVKRVGAHSFTSAEMAHLLGGAVQARHPQQRVDLRSPEAVIGVEIRGDDCYLFDRVLPGRDRRSGEPPPLAEPRFLADQMLGRLAVWLRLLGFDTVRARDDPDSRLLRRAREERRILLTRDRALARVRGANVQYVASSSLGEQLREVVERLGLRLDRKRMFSRCSRCNRPLEPVDKESMADRIPPIAFRLFDEFTRCDACGKLYWQGGHYDRVLSHLQDMVAGPR